MDSNVDRSGTPPPGYRPPVSPGQVYPALGYGPDGGARFSYDDKLRSENPTPVAPEPAPVAPPPEPPDEGRDRRRLAIGFAAIVVGLLCLVLAFRALTSSPGDEPATRADPPSSQSTDDPYLQGIPAPSESERPSEPSTSAPNIPSAGTTVTYEVESGPATVIYVDDVQARIIRTAGGSWTKTVQGTENSLLRVMVIPQGADPATCSIKIDGREVVRQTSREGAASSMVNCRYAG